MPPTRERYNLAQTPGLPSSVLSQSRESVPAPIVSVSVGSTGMARTAHWFRKMAALDVSRRIQAMAVYDCNGTSVDLWQKACARYGVNGISITPEYLPLSEGFLRQPNDYLSHHGPIERDMEQVVDRMEELSTAAGSRPQVILEWIGFGGHARLSNLLHEMVSQRFPSAQVLPIYSIPNERVLEANIRDYNLWDESVAMMGTGVAMLTDNRITANLPVLDERIAIGLAAVEASFQFRPDAGTLAEVVASFNLARNRWLSMDVSDLPFKHFRPAKRPWYQRLPGRRNEMPPMASSTDLSALAQMVKEVVWDIAEPGNDENHTGFFEPWGDDVDQRIFVVLPFDDEMVERIRDDVQDNLQRENFRRVYDGTQVHFGVGNAMWRERTDYAFGHVVKLAGLPADPMPLSLKRVLHPNGEFQGRVRQFPTRGEQIIAAKNGRKPQ